MLKWLRAAQRPIIWVVQRTILHVTLLLLYFIGFGVTKLFMMLFARRTLLNLPRDGVRDDSWWRPAEGYEPDEARMRRQS